MTKYRQAVEEMVAQHKDEFEEFKRLRYEDTKFHEFGKPLLRLVEQAENRLCGKMEGGNKGMFSQSLADKFRAEVKKLFPLIDLVGVEIS